MTALRNIVWKGFEYASKEHCNVATTADEILISGTIRSRPADIDLNVSYAIRLNLAWETQAVRIAGSFDKRAFDYDFQRIGAIWRNWDGTELPGATEPDISLSPLTNTLPIRRLRMSPGETAEIDVVYFDLAARTVDVRRQSYSRLDERQYRFQTVPEDFEAILEVDEGGFVTDYPGLFSRV